MRRLLFVYGTLMSAESNAGMLAAASFAGRAATTADFDLIDCTALPGHGCFPGLRPGGRTSVKGELYWADDRVVAALDEFEGHPDLFARARITLAGGGWAEAYLLPPGRGAGARVIPSGDWRAHQGRSRRRRLAVGARSP